MNGLKPGALMIMGGGVLLFIAVFLDWSDGGDVNGFDIDGLGFHGIWVFLIALAAIGLVAARAFANVQLPEKILGFSIDEWIFIDSLIAFFIMFGYQPRDFTGAGILLGWIAAAIMVAGAFMEIRGIGSPIGASSAASPDAAGPETSPPPAPPAPGTPPPPPPA
ncbi:MAG: hypothetical protein HKN26_04085 [Acidimicrobiales bacterium]|nr:hypothetical protein [Acidimicrobiales bacterium]